MSLKVSGTYKEFFETLSDKKAKGTELELRIDIDGNHPLDVVSGDLYSNSGKTRQYVRSFRFEGVKNVSSQNNISITGVPGFFSDSNNNSTRIDVTIDPNCNPYSANVEWTDGLGKKSTSLCKYSSPYFREVMFENDYEENVTPFSCYNTDSLPCPVKKGTLTVIDALDEAGIHAISIKKASNSIRMPQDPKANYAWTDSELHAAMEANFSQWKDAPQWKVWLFSARQYENSQVRGLMFDHKGKQRQGCAVFHGLEDRSEEQQRRKLFVYVHELSHCFNLLHPWDRSGANTPGGIEEYSCLSWLNYPWAYYQSEESCGESGFWDAFDFKFIDSELMHLRHGFRDDVIFGGNDFGTGASASFDDSAPRFSSPTENNSGLILRLEPTKPTFAYGEPVVVEIRLSAVQETLKVHNCLHPKQGLVQVAICDPSQHTKVYKPLLNPFIVPDEQTIGENSPFYDSAYIGYGQDGFYFSQPGQYRIRAIYRGLDCSNIFSNEITIKVRYPHNQDEEDVASLLFGDAQGMLLYLMGSDSDLLQKGNDAFSKLINEYPDQSLTTYARFAKGFNIGRWFKKINSNLQMEIRNPDLGVTQNLLRSVIDTSTMEGLGLDNISLNQTMTHLAQLQKMFGFEDAATKTIEQMKDIFKNKRHIKPSVLVEIEETANKILS